MTEDFVTRLGQALSEAADREESRNRPARAAATVRASVPRAALTPGFALLAVAAVFALFGYVVETMRSEPTVASPPKVVARLAPAEGLEQGVAAFGAVWLVDTGRGALLRMDPAGRTVTARVPLHGSAALGVGPDAVWVGETDGVASRLVRVDPETGRIVARTALRTPHGGLFQGGTPIQVGDVLWVVGVEHALRLDPRTGRITKAIRIAPGGYGVRGATSVGGDVWALVSNGNLVRFDGRTGGRKRVFPARYADLAAGPGGAMLLVADGRRIARFDPSTGRALWVAPIRHEGTGAIADGLFWVASLDPGPASSVVGMDPRTGRIVSSVHVGESGTMSIVRVGSELWMTTAAGHVVILRP
jgi:streptogramin lyase